MNLFWKFVWLMKPYYQTIFTEDLPSVVEKKRIYVIGTKEYPWQIAFLCPCGCKELIQLSLLRDTKPCWKFKLTNNREITLYPSVWRKIGCKSHFHVEKGKISWTTNWFNRYFQSKP